MSDKEHVPSYHGHRQRLRDRFNNSGLVGMHDYEKLELLLTFAIPRRDVKPIARELLEHFGDLAGVLEAGRYDLEQLSGIGEQASILLRLIRALGSDYLETRVRKSEVLSRFDEVARFARMKIGGAAYENFMAIYLDPHNQVLHHESSEGTVDHANVYPRNVLRRCIELHATGFIVIHNHPSGVCEPSEDDEHLTEQLQRCAEIHGIRFLDHLLITRSECHSILYRRPRRRGVADDGAPYASERE